MQIQESYKKERLEFIRQSSIQHLSNQPIFLFNPFAVCLSSQFSASLMDILAVRLRFLLISESTPNRSLLHWRILSERNSASPVLKLSSSCWRNVLVELILPSKYYLFTFSVQELMKVRQSSAHWKKEQVRFSVPHRSLKNKLKRVALR